MPKLIKLGGPQGAIAEKMGDVRVEPPILVDVVTWLEVGGGGPPRLGHKSKTL